MNKSGKTSRLFLGFIVLCTSHAVNPAATEILPGEVEVMLRGTGPDFQWGSSEMFVHVRPNGEIWMPLAVPGSIANFEGGFARFDRNMTNLPPIRTGGHPRAPVLSLKDGSILANLLSPLFPPKQLYHLSYEGRILRAIPTDGPVLAVARQEDGKVLVAGKFSTISGVAKNCIARLNQDLSVDPTFDIGIGPFGLVVPQITALEIQNDDRILIGGMFSYLGLVQRLGIARLSTDGSLDPSFDARTNVFSGTQGSFRLNGIVESEGWIYVGSWPGNLVRLDSTGGLDRSLNPGGEITALRKQRDGKILFGSHGLGAGSLALGRLLVNGDIDPVFRTLPSRHVVICMDLDFLDRIIVSGYDYTGSDSPIIYTAILASDATAEYPPFKVGLLLNATDRTTLIEITGPSGFDATIESSHDLMFWKREGTSQIVNGRGSVTIEVDTAEMLFVRGKLE
jgi:uncharacterized delta-60 repeat protein